LAILAIAAIVFGIVIGTELPDTSGLAALMLGTRYRPSWVFVGTAAAFAVHGVIAVAAGSLVDLFPHRVVQGAVAVVFLIGAVLIFRPDDDDDDARLKQAGAGFWQVVTASFAVIMLAELGDPSEIVIANLAARYHSPVLVGAASILALWVVAAVAISGGRSLMRFLPLQWITRLAAAAMVIMAGLSLAEAIR